MARIPVFGWALRGRCGHRLRWRSIAWQTVTVLLVVSIAAGCATRIDQIAVERLTCCDADVAWIETYRIEVDGMPGFLEPYFVDGLTAVLAGKGLRRVPHGEADAIVRLAYDQWDIDTREPIPLADAIAVRVDEADAHDPASRREFGAQADRIGFLPRVRTEVRVIGTAEPIWAGVLSRVHRFSVGEYMHERARVSIHAAYSELFEAWPLRPDAPSAR